MADMTDYLETALINHVFMASAYTAPGTIYLALFTTLPGEDGTGGTEVSGGSYARQAVAWELGTAGTGVVRNDGAETFTNMPSCTVVGVGLYDDSTAGNLLARKALGSPIVYAASDSASLADNALTFTLA